LDHGWGKAGDEDLAENNSIDFRSTSVHIQDLNVAFSSLVRKNKVFSFVPSILLELIEEAGFLQGALAGLGVQIERAALGSRIGRAFALEDCDVADAGTFVVEDAGER
jgi:hypothetical protein